MSTQLKITTRVMNRNVKARNILNLFMDRSRFSLLVLYRVRLEYDMLQKYKLLVNDL